MPSTLHVFRYPSTSDVGATTQSFVGNAIVVVVVVATGGSVVVVCGGGGSVVTGGAVVELVVVGESDVGVHAAASTTADRPTNQMTRFIALEHTVSGFDSDHKAIGPRNLLTNRRILDICISKVLRNNR